MTEKERHYIATGGVRCWDCYSEDISGGPVEIEDGEARQEVTCGSCGKGWVDVYKLVEIER